MDHEYQFCCPDCGEATPAAEIGGASDDDSEWGCPVCFVVSPSDDWSPVDEA